MKKWLIGVVSVFLLFLISSYFFIPRKIVVTKSITANANQTGVYRFLTEDSNWTKWWPGKTSRNEEQKLILESQGYQFNLNNILYSSFEITIEKNKHADTALLYVVAAGPDSSKIIWNVSIKTSLNPINKIRQYFRARKLGHTLEDVLSAMQSHIVDKKSIYGLDIRKEKVRIEYLVTTIKKFPYYPKTEDIYDMVNQIRNYIVQSGAKEDDYPFLNLKKSDSLYYETQVGIPVNRQLPQTSQFFSKRMLRNGDVLVAEVTGGKNAFDSAMKNVELFATDYQYINIALPILSLVTDRTKEADSSKWLSKIYYPIK